MTRRVLVSCLAIAGSLTLFLHGQERVAPRKGGQDVSGPYEVVPNWPQPPSDPTMTWGRTSSVWADSPDRVFIIQSGMVPLTWKKLQGERLIGATHGGGTPIRTANNAVHCASTLAWDLAWHCQKRADGTLIDALVEQQSGAPIEGAKWNHTLMILNRDGRLVETWDQYSHLFGHPHTIMTNPYDPERHVWVVDAGSEQIFKFSNDGKKLVMTLGEPRVPGNDARHFRNPTGIAFLPNGDFFVSDGYKNTRVVKFSKDGRYAMEFGKPGKGPGEFNTVHSIAIDAKGRIYIADRGNSRIQVFDMNGRFLDEWPDIRFPLFIAVSKDQHLWVSDGSNNKILKYSLDGQLLYSWGTFGNRPGDIWGVHNFTVDAEGSFYTAEVFGGRAQKFRPRQGADPKFLVGPLQSPGSTLDGLLR